MEIPEWPIEEGEKIRTSKKEVLEQTINYLKFIFYLRIEHQIQFITY